MELDEASWLAFETMQPTGGSVNACNPTTLVCSQIATGIPIVSAATVGRDGQVFVVKNALVPGAADVVALP